MPKREENRTKRMDTFKKTYIRNWIICIVTFILCVLLYAYSESQGTDNTSSEPTEAVTVVCSINL